MVKNIFLFIYIACLFLCAFLQLVEVDKHNYTNNVSDQQRFYVSNGYKSKSAYIAHGGGIGVFNYTNTLEAMHDSLKRGFKFIEIDMLETSDGHIVGGHDWISVKYLAQYPHINDNPLSLSEVEALKIYNIFHIVTGNDIKNIMKKNKELILITDKIKNYELLLKKIPFPDRMIVEVFSVQDYFRALESGVKYPAYCIWNLESYEEARQFGFPIVTMDAKYFFEKEDTISKVQELHDNKVTILLYYTSFSKRDQPDWVKKYVGKTISKIYTDTWSPNNLPH